MKVVQKKLILVEIVQMLLNGEKTRTTLKRSLKVKAAFSEIEIEDAINYGVEHSVLGALSHGYIKVLRPDFAVLETDYYNCMEQMLKDFYEKQMTENGRFLVARTARKDTKVAGRWTRPDFTVVATRKFPYIREAEFDIITFEVKRPADCEALAVFEALAHNSAATRSYVFFPLTETELDENLQGERIREECVRHGIGLFLAADSYRLQNAHLVIQSQRRPLNPEKCSHFLKNVLTADELSTLSAWQ